MADLGHEMCQLLPAVGMFLLVLCLRGPWSPVPAVSLPWLSPFLCVLCSEEWISSGRGWHYSELYLASLLSAQTCASPSMPYGQTSGSQAHANISCAASGKSILSPLSPGLSWGACLPLVTSWFCITLLRSSQLCHPLVVWARASSLTHARSTFCVCEMANLLSRAHRKILWNPTGDLADKAQSKSNLAGCCCFPPPTPCLYWIEQRSPEPVQMKQEVVGSDILSSSAGHGIRGVVRTLESISANPLV